MMMMMMAMDAFEKNKESHEPKTLTITNKNNEGIKLASRARTERAIRLIFTVLTYSGVGRLEHLLNGTWLSCSSIESSFNANVL